MLNIKQSQLEAAYLEPHPRTVAPSTVPQGTAFYDRITSLRPSCALTETTMWDVILWTAVAIPVSFIFAGIVTAFSHSIADWKSNTASWPPQL